MGDYPDWTDLVQIVGSDIMVPIDVQGAYIMLPVDIQGQYVTLEMDIVAQSVGNIEVDIAAQSAGDIKVDIDAQTIGDITIDIDAQSVGVYLQGDWAALYGTDKNFYCAYGSAAWGDEQEISYTVPSGKTLLICAVAARCGAEAAANANSNQMVWAYIYNATLLTVIWETAGNGGLATIFNKPLAFGSNTALRFRVRNMTNHDASKSLSVIGYEV